MRHICGAQAYDRSTNWHLVAAYPSVGFVLLISKQRAGRLSVQPTHWNGHGLQITVLSWPVLVLPPLIFLETVRSQERPCPQWVCTRCRPRPNASQGNPECSRILIPGLSPAASRGSQRRQPLQLTDDKKTCVIHPRAHGILRLFQNLRSGERT